MNKFLSLILAIVTAMLPMVAQDSADNSSSEPVELDVRLTRKKSDGRHHMPIHINIYANYNIEEGTLEICNDGDANGEVFLYLNGNLIGYDSEINTSFHISAPGLYKIEIVSDSWIATGSFRI